MALPVSFGGLVIWAKIYDADNHKVEDFGVIDSTRGGFSRRPYLSEVRIKEGIRGTGEIGITLTPPTYSEGMKLLESSVIKIGNTLGVRWGYSGDPTQMSPWYYGYMVRPDVSLGEEISITINAHTLGWMAERQQTGKVWSNYVTGKVMTPRAIIEALADKHKLKIDLNHGKPLPKDVKKKFEEVQKGAIVQGSLNDYVFIKLLASRAGMKAWISRGTLFLSAAASDREKIAGTFRFRGQIDTANRIYPIFSFESQTTAMFLPVRAMSARWYNAAMDRSKGPKIIRRDQTTGSGTQLKNKVVAPPDAHSTTVNKTDDGTNVAVNISPKNKDEWSCSEIPVATREDGIESLIQNASDLNAQKTGEPCKFRTMPIPGLAPDDLVEVQGVGKWFEGLWVVWELETTIGESGGETSVDLRTKGFEQGSISKWLSKRAKSQHKPAKRAKPGSATKTAKKG